MSSLELVVHCFSGDKVPIYHRLAQLQFSSLLLHIPTIETVVSICYCPDDKLTVEIIDWFECGIKNISNLYLNRISLSREELFRRAYGRNIAAKESSTEVIWFSDIDYLFCDKSTLQLALHYCLKSERNMVFPEVININVTHGFGDGYVERMSKYPPHTIKIDPDHFMPRKEKKAIGGIQIVTGDWARENGYLDNTKWTQPVDPSKGFRSCKGDVPFRKQVGPSEAVDIPGVYRIRHSFCGRDGGSRDHGKVKT